MSTDTVIKVENVSKKFSTSIKRSMAYGTIDVLQSFVGIQAKRNKLRKSEFWALDNINFELKQGEKIGFLGKNGSGKSTLLRLINGIFPPDQGKITVRGKIGALIAVGAGFHPHMTGRENVYLNGAILGMTNQEISAKFDEIVEFAEIGDFIDAPVSTYSSGMYVRLGFAIAIHTQPDILLVDEVLSVGDLAFQIKCQKKLSEYRQNGGSFIIVSHNMQTIRNTCDRVIWLEKGEIIKEGDVYTVCNEYETNQINQSWRSTQQSEKGNKYNIDSQINLENIVFGGEKKDEAEFILGDDFKLGMELTLERKVNNPIITVSIINSLGDLVFEVYTDKLSGIKEGKNQIDLFIKNLNIRPGLYDCTITVSENEILNKLLWHEKSYHFKVVNKSNLDINQGLMYVAPQWEIK